ncbi:hypothetical protein LTR36_000950 [Oleoguttula mirabilis]|uniref:DUF7905 domain-containing protein n=1 Tax=Oleoguttula mirabilis TaxID=1507867 RepID=A0AAV9JQQ5_9PEZI|nr:hypothetical protein LTR36_000950 [Oleoguttula mirabilis]
MDDYERTNAREWDASYQQAAGEQAAQQGWHVVTNSKKRELPPQKPAEQVPRPNEPQPQQPMKLQRPQPPQQPVQQHQRSVSLQQRQQQVRHPRAAAIPRQWQTSGPQRPERTKREPLKLVHNSDNDAEAAWRARAKPTDEVRIPEDLVLQKNAYHEEAARQYGAFIFSLHARGSAGSKTFGIWGEAKAVALTKRAIANWIEASKGNRNTDSRLKFPRIVSLTPKLREREEKRWIREVTRQRYRQHPPPDMAFQAIASFHWPTQEHKPEEMLGASHEALDPVRMDCACYVVFSKERSIFRVMGKAVDVQAGLQRLRATCFQIASRQLNPVRTYLLRWRQGAQIPLYLYLKEHSRPAILAPEDPVADKPSGRSPAGEGTHPDEARSRYAGIQTVLNFERLRSLIFKTLRKMHYYRGSVQMRIRLGTFLVTQYREPQGGSYELEEWESMIVQSQFEGKVTHE